MELRNLKKGDKLYAVYNWLGQLYCDHIYECTIKKVITKDFVTRIYLDDGDKGIGKRAVGYYLSNCALNENYLFTVTDDRLKEVYQTERDSHRYFELLDARSRIFKFIKEGK